MISNEDSIYITIKDSGIGINKEDIPKLFKLFGKLEQSNKEINTTGVGLGLTISQNLVNLLANKHPEGRIKVKSEPNKGSEFSFPIIGIDCSSDDDNFDSIMMNELSKNESFCQLVWEPKQAITLEDSKKKASPANFLIVDDNPINIMVEKSYLLTLKNVTIDTAFNGQEAISLVKKGVENSFHYDYVLMDCNMPVMDGFECTIKLKTFCKEFKIRPPIIVGITANVSERDKLECLKAGMDFYLTKPLRKEELLKLL